MVVAAGPLRRVDPGRRNELGKAVGTETNAPTALGIMNHPVVVATEEHKVVQARGTAGGPGTQVVGFAPAAGSVAAGKAAPAIPSPQRPAQRPGGEPATATDIQHLPVTAEHDGQQAGVTREPPGRGRRNAGAVVQGPGTQPAGQRVDRDRDVELGWFSTVGGQFGGAQSKTADVDERVGAPLCRVAVVVAGGAHNGSRAAWRTAASSTPSRPDRWTMPSLGGDSVK